MGHKTGKYELIRVEGPARERGRQYGASAASLIQRNIDAYLRLIEFHSGQGREMAMQAASAYGPVIGEHAPELLAEMQGIAEGAGCDLVDILLINARSELMLAVDECTSLAAAPEVTDRGQVLLGQNWDWYTSVEPEPVLLHIRQPAGPEILTLTEAGQVGKIGLNSAGLGVCLNFLEHSDQGQGLPVHVILRQMLGCDALGDAVRAALSVPRGGAANILIAHGQGEILDLELTAADADYFYGDAGWLVHANHFESDRLRPGDTLLPTSRSTLARAARARRLLSGVRGGVSTDTFRAILADHAYGAYAICRHADPSEPLLQQTATRASVIMDLQSCSMYLSVGQPCQQAYEPITLQPSP
jgi:isopenicillin-N N-acyltransferase-like protein